jgi:hypothetical protein
VADYNWEGDCRRTRVVSCAPFLQTDPIPGGSCNPYDYACQDPINMFDLNGTDLSNPFCSFPGVVCAKGGRQNLRSNNPVIRDATDAELAEIIKDGVSSEALKQHARQEQKVRRLRRSSGGDGRNLSRFSVPNVSPTTVGTAATAAGAGALLWWLAKLGSPVCGPAVVVCAVAF